jgi:hypothetical protein
MDMQHFDGWEVHPCRYYQELDDYDGVMNTQFEQISATEVEQYEPHVVWSVYGHLPEGGIRNICDCYHSQTAIDVAYAFEKAFGPTQYGVAYIGVREWDTPNYEEETWDNTTK